MLDEFVYHPPNSVTAPRYKAIREQEQRTVARVQDAISGDLTLQQTFDEINRSTKEYYDLLTAVVPECSDKDTALRCVRLARMALNESVVTSHMAQPGFTPPRLIGLDSLREARWWACAAVALNLADTNLV